MMVRAKHPVAQDPFVWKLKGQSVENIPDDDQSEHPIAKDPSVSKLKGQSVT